MPLKIEESAPFFQVGSAPSEDLRQFSQTPGGYDVVSVGTQQVVIPFDASLVDLYGGNPGETNDLFEEGYLFGTGFQEMDFQPGSADLYGNSRESPSSTNIQKFTFVGHERQGNEGIEDQFAKDPLPGGQPREVHPSVPDLQLVQEDAQGFQLRPGQR
jgi:hypothetical protein